MVRPAEVRDLPSIAKLYHRVWHETHGSLMPYAEREARDKGFFQNRMAALMPNVLVCDNGNAVIGFASWEGALLGQLFLDASARGTGLAGSLMEAAERRLWQQGIREAELHCLVGNERAKRFYERTGWSVSAIMPEAVRSDMDCEQRDFWVMHKRFSPQVP